MKAINVEDEDIELRTSKIEVDEAGDRLANVVPIKERLKITKELFIKK